MQKAMLFLILSTWHAWETSSDQFPLTTATKIDMFKSQDVESIYVHFYLSDVDEPYTKNIR